MMTQPNAPAWFDISTPDAGRAREFYGMVFGWTAHAANPDYSLLMNGSEQGPIGGMGQSGPQSPYTGLVLYIGVDDVDAALERAETAGASRTLLPVSVPGQGRIAVFRDPDGNHVGLIGPDGNEAGR